MSIEYELEQSLDIAITAIYRVYRVLCLILSYQWVPHQQPQGLLGEGLVSEKGALDLSEFVWQLDFQELLDFWIISPLNVLSALIDPLSGLSLLILL